MCQVVWCASKIRKSSFLFNTFHVQSLNRVSYTLNACFPVCLMLLKKNYSLHISSMFKENKNRTKNYYFVTLIISSGNLIRLCCAADFSANLLNERFIQTDLSYSRNFFLFRFLSVFYSSFRFLNFFISLLIFIKRHILKVIFNDLSKKKEEITL